MKIKQAEQLNQEKDYFNKLKKEEKKDENKIISLTNKLKETQSKLKKVSENYANIEKK